MSITSEEYGKMMAELSFQDMTSKPIVLSLEQKEGFDKRMRELQIQAGMTRYQRRHLN